eukprot:jgi/Bigna1/59722/fgenesh1_kg.6_\
MHIRSAPLWLVLLNLLLLLSLGLAARNTALDGSSSELSWPSVSRSHAMVMCDVASNIIYAFIMHHEIEV